jgi:hypothetical protein
MLFEIAKNNKLSILHKWLPIFYIGCRRISILILWLMDNITIKILQIVAAITGH